MLDNKSLEYKDIFNILRKVILERDFAEVINLETLIREQHPLIVRNNSNIYPKELELIELSSIYIFCVMIKKDEEAIFPYLREYVLRILIDTFFEMQPSNIANKLNQDYNLDHNSVEQRYLYILATMGFNAFNSSIGLSKTDEINEDVIRKMFQKFFLIEYDRFNTETIQGLFLFYRYQDRIDFELDPVTKLLFETILKRLVTILVDYDAIERNRECEQEISFENQILDSANKINIID